MAETEAAGHAAKGLGGTLGKKVGPLPLGVWLAIGGGLWWWTNRQSGGSSSTAATDAGQAAAQQQLANAGGASGYGTDQAGNTGYIDPSTGYVYGSAEDISALQAQSAGDAGDSPASLSQVGGDTSTVTPGGTLTGTGTTGTGTTGTGTTGTGGTGGTGTGGTSTAGSGSGWRYPPPARVTVSAVSRTGYSLSWPAVTGPNGQKPASYTVKTMQTNGVVVDQFTATGTSTKEYGKGGKGLHPGWTYRTDVWANGGPLAPNHAQAVVTLKP